MQTTGGTPYIFSYSPEDLDLKRIDYGKAVEIIRQVYEEQE